MLVPHLILVPENPQPSPMVILAPFFAVDIMQGQNIPERFESFLFRNRQFLPIAMFEPGKRSNVAFLMKLHPFPNATPHHLALTQFLKL